MCPSVCWQLSPEGGGGGHSPWFWVPTAKRTPRAVAVDLKKKKRGAVTDPRPLRRGAVRGAFHVGAVVVSLASPTDPGKHPGLAVTSVLATVKRVIVSGQLKMMSSGGKPQ